MCVAERGMCGLLLYSWTVQISLAHFFRVILTYMTQERGLSSCTQPSPSLLHLLHTCPQRAKYCIENAVIKTKKEKALLTVQYLKMVTRGRRVWGMFCTVWSCVRILEFLPRPGQKAAVSSRRETLVSVLQSCNVSSGLLSGINAWMDRIGHA